MEKIIVLTNRQRDDDKLIKCLSMLFPECEIEIRTSQPEVYNNSSSTSEPTENESVDKKLEKLLSFL